MVVSISINSQRLPKIRLISGYDAKCLRYMGADLILL